MESKVQYEFTTTIWQHTPPSGWYFVSLPILISKEIREHFKWQEEGWGRMKVLAKIEVLKWNTSIWFDTKAKTYLLPVKAEIRRKLNLKVNKTIKVTIWV